MQKKEVEVFYPKSQTAWRKWLEKNHLSKESVWVVFYSKISKKKSISWSDAVDVALCFGWIDSKKIKIDFETSHQFFSKRKPNSTWSKINKTKVEMLIEHGLMSDAGLKSIETAKENGSWTILDDVEALIIPADLEAAFAKKPIAEAYYQSLSKSAKKMLLSWLKFAKTSETRNKRITEIVTSALQKQKPKHLR
ncbi:MAG: YdeI/OmpD-associated family protein [Bacteroidia bacterium]|nr:YdeI/OmpD-associated family protein [Bacteroidia bacterium]